MKNLFFALLAALVVACPASADDQVEFSFLGVKIHQVWADLPWCPLPDIAPGVLVVDEPKVDRVCNYAIEGHGDALGEHPN